MPLFDVIGGTGFQPRNNRGRPVTEFLPALQGERGIRTYREMQDNEVAIGSALALMESTVSQVKWRPKEAGSDQRSKDEAEFLEGIYNDMLMTWNEFICDALHYWTFGSQLYELNFKRRAGFNFDETLSSRFMDGRIGLRDLGVRPQETLKEWQWDENGVLVGVWQHLVNMAEVVFIPASKFVIYKTRSSRGNPEGKPGLRPLHRGWYRLKQYEDIEGVGYDRNVQGVLVQELPQEYLDYENKDPQKTAARNEYLKQLGQWHRNDMSGFLTPSSKNKDGDTGFLLRAMSVDTSSVLGELGKAIQRLKRELAVGLNAQFQWLGQGTSSGSRAVSGDQVDMYVLACEALLDTIQETTDKYITQRIYRLNGVPEKFRAAWVHDPVSREDLKQFAENMATLINSGAVTRDDNLEEHTRDKMAYPPRDPTADDLDPDAGSGDLTPAFDDPEEDDPTEPPAPKPAPGGA